MKYSLSAFSEPRGVMRILQFIFSICAFVTTANFTLNLDLTCPAPKSIAIDYPFRVERIPDCQESMSVDVSTDAQFFVATGVLSLMYSVFIIAVYALLDELYRSKSEIPLADFMLTTVLAIFWLSGSAAWANGTNALKSATDEEKIRDLCKCTAVARSSFSRLNISLILGFLNFFLWASDLWFLYKETIWFQGRRPQAQPGPSGVAPGPISPNV